MAGPQRKIQDLNGQTIRDMFFEFILNFQVVSPDEPEFNYYVKQIRAMHALDSPCLLVQYNHLNEYNSNLATIIVGEYLRFEPFIKSAVAAAVREIEPDFAMQDEATNTFREFYVGFYGFPLVSKIRDLKMGRVGMLTAIHGTVTRTSEVRPELMFGVFRCKMCSSSSDQVEQQFKYTEPVQCKNPACQNSGSGTDRWELLLDRSRFVDWQRVRVQENSDEIPAGSMPRSLDIILRHGHTEKAKAGDKVTFTGCLVVVPDVHQLYKQGAVASSRPGPSQRSAMPAGIAGLRALGVRDLTYRTAFLAHTVASGTDPSVLMGEDNGGGPDAEYADSLTEEEKNTFLSMAHSKDAYAELVGSVAPTIHGHDSIKKGVLLQLLGGVHKRTPEGIRLRGDINVCIVGDPSTAKSQFLKYAARFMPRAVYTSGKASTAAGLTASIAKDPDTGEFCIEAGALMLADNGICCIDEFDKMDNSDQVAIHEAMEQQTISITKAGIQATLNARASILAAANPIFGRYDKSKTLRQNVAIGAPIMSRFDLFFVVLDEPDEAADERIARHIVAVHRKRENAVLPAEIVRQAKEKRVLARALARTHALQSDTSGPTEGHSSMGGRGTAEDDEEDDEDMDDKNGRKAPKYTLQQLQGFVRFARSLKPRFTKEAQASVVKAYIKMRQDDAVGASKSSYRITVRQLEAVVRLSEALARLHLTETVTAAFVHEAHALLKRSILNVDTGAVDLDSGMLDPELDAEEAAGMGMPFTPPRSERVVPAGAAAENAAGEDEGVKGAQPKAPTARAQIGADTYRRIEYMFALCLRRAQDDANNRLRDNEKDVARFDGAGNLVVPMEAHADRAKAQDYALTGDALVKFYMNAPRPEGEFMNEDEVAEERKMLDKVLWRLATKDDVLEALTDLPDRKAPGGLQAIRDTAFVLSDSYVLQGAEGGLVEGEEGF